MSKVVPPPHPHQEAINNLAARVLPRVKALPFAQNQKEPWLGNTAVDKAVLATIETIFNIADEDRAANIKRFDELEFNSEDSEPQAVTTSAIELPEMDQG
jgi:hypothetical protein